MPASISGTSPSIVSGVITPPAELRRMPEMPYLLISTHCTTGRKAQLELLVEGHHNVDVL